jgi:hypothetical protein
VLGQSLLTPSNNVLDLKSHSNRLEAPPRADDRGRLHSPISEVARLRNGR